MHSGSILALLLLLVPASRAGDWKLTFEDDFNGGTGECFRPERLFCRVNPGLLRPCPEEDHPGLRDLNRCHWSVYQLENFWPQDPPALRQNGFSPALVSVGNGILHLRSRRSPTSPGACSPGRDCPIRTGAIDSLGGFGTRTFAESGFPDLTGPTGFQQAYGRFEVRLRIHDREPGSWPAAWTLAHQPQSIRGVPFSQSWPGHLRGWPRDGELDLMEAWGTRPGEASQTLHSDNSGVGRFQRVDTENFHVFGMQWEKDSVRFYIDGILNHEVRRDEEAIPFAPEYWILNLSMIGDRASPAAETDFEIDWVRTYRRCDAGQTGCVALPEIRSGEYSLKVAPNPLHPGQTARVTLRSNVTCASARLLLLNSAGSVLSQTGALALAPPTADEVIARIPLTIPTAAAGVHFVQAQLQGCGPSGGKTASVAERILVVP